MSGWSVNGSMWPERVSNPGPRTYESGVLPTALRSPAQDQQNHMSVYDSGILHQDYRIIQGMLMNHTRFSDWVTFWVVHLLEQIQMGRPYYLIGPDRASHVQLQ